MSDPVPYPLLLEPRYIEKVWGGRRMERVFGRALPGDGPIGESWEMFDRPAGSSVVRNGPLAGRTLRQLRGGTGLPLLLKVLDIGGNISVQVHPDDATAKAHGTEPKTEAWIVLEADPGARIWRGFRDGVTPEVFQDAMTKGRVLETLHSFTPVAGDVVLVQAGVVHAMGGGILAVEIQQSSETTYRLWDWDREGDGRRLQREPAMQALRFHSAGPDRIVPREEEDEGGIRRTLLVANRWFAAEHLTVPGISTFANPRDDADRWHMLFVLKGRGRVRAFDRRAPEAPFLPGDTILLPAGHESYEVEPEDGTTVEALAFREG